MYAYVAAVNLKCRATSQAIITPYDLVGAAIFDLIVAQGSCACNGIFLRGGLSHGPFHFENDVLLSPALANAYSLESKRADFPIIAISPSTIRWILNRPGRHVYAEDNDPMNDCFRMHDASRPGEELFFLDYLGVLVNEEHRGLVSPEREQYIAAKSRRDYAKADQIFERSVYKDAAYFFRYHRLAIEKAYRISSVVDVRRKYRWVAKYHNSSIRTDVPYLPRQRVDPSRLR